MREHRERRSPQVKPRGYMMNVALRATKATANGAVVGAMADVHVGTRVRCISIDNPRWG